MQLCSQVRFGIFLKSHRASGLRVMTADVSDKSRGGLHLYVLKEAVFVKSQSELCQRPKMSLRLGVKQLHLVIPEAPPGRR